MGVGGSWRGTAGAALSLIGTYVLAVTPIAALHFGLTQQAMTRSGSTGALLGLAVVDGLVSTVQLVVGVAIAVVAYRFAADRAGPLRTEGAVA